MARPKFVYTTAASDPVIETISVTSGAAAGDYVMRDTTNGGVKLWAPAASVYICGICEASDTQPATFTKPSGAGAKTTLVGGVGADLRGQAVMGGRGPTGKYDTANAGHYTPIRVGDVYEMDLKQESSAYVEGIAVFVTPGTTGAQLAANAAGNSEPASGILLKLVKTNAGQVGRGQVKFTAVEAG